MTERETEFVELFRQLTDENQRIMGAMIVELAKRSMKGDVNNEA